jgi:response regulator NasT
MAETQRRIVVAHVRPDSFALVTRAIVDLGHLVIVGTVELPEIVTLVADEQPDIAFIGADIGAERTLELIERISRQGVCPVVALLDRHDVAFIREAAKRGVYAYLVQGSAHDVQGVLEVGLRSFARYRELQGAFGRRAVTERAKGILMERYRVDERRAFAMLRDYARAHELSLVAVAQATIDRRVLDDPRALPG